MTASEDVANKSMKNDSNIHRSKHGFTKIMLYKYSALTAGADVVLSYHEKILCVVAEK